MTERRPVPPPFDPAVLGPDPDRRAAVLRWLAAALAAVDPTTATARQVVLGEDTVRLGETEVPLEGRVARVAIGKAAPAMARSVAGPGIVVTHAPLAVPAGWERLVAGHPLPDARSVAAARLALSTARGLGLGDVLVVLLSGGASALLEAPMPPLSLADLRTAYEVLLRAGASIDETNTVRKHLSTVKGGRLAEAALPARTVTAALSDVPGDRLDVIGSGPTVPDPTTFADAMAVIDRHRLRARMPPVAMRILEAGVAGQVPDTPAELPGHHAIVVAGGRDAAHAVAEAARAEGHRAAEGDRPLTGPTEAAVDRVLGSSPIGVTAWTGETTPAVPDRHGRGGRNLHAALVAATAIDGRPDIVAAFLATDGKDGDTDAAGAIVDGGTVTRGRAAGLDPAAHLERFDSYPFLAATGDILRTGPTGTNVADLWVVWRGAPRVR